MSTWSEICRDPSAAEQIYPARLFARYLFTVTDFAFARTDRQRERERERERERGGGESGDGGREGERERETIRVKWPKFSQQISLTKIQSSLVAIEGCIVGPWKMAVGNNRITSLARDAVGTGRWGKRENKRRERHSWIRFDTLKIN